MKKTTARRFGAYIMDMIIIALISSMFVKIEFINPKYDEYLKVYNEYLDYTSEIKDIKQLENDSKITDLSYDLAKTGIASSIISLVVTTLYFVGFQYLNRGQTLGKKVFKIKVVDGDNGRVKLYQLLVRSLLINSILTSFITILAVAFLSKAAYFKTIQFTQLFDVTVLCASFILMMFREDGKGLHDLLICTRVVFDEVEEETIKEAKVVEKEETKKITKKKTTRKEK